MKKFLLCAALCYCVINGSFAQDITGKWYGSLNVQGTALALVFDITKTDSVYSTTLDSPDQGVKGIKVNATTFRDGVLTLKADALKMEYTGTLKANTIEGIFQQSGFSIPLNLTNKPVEKQKINRPQEPLAPFAYYSEDVVFKNTKDNVQLAGTLTLPQKEGRFSVVVMVTGSGPQDRNEELLGHKPFLVIADYFAKNGVGVLRFDDRGVGKSTGTFGTATSFDFANDAEAAVQYLKTRTEVNKIGIAGHSEGGAIAPMVAARNRDISFVILLAGPGITGDKLLLEQNYLIAKADGVGETELSTNKMLNTKIYSLIKKARTADEVKTNLTALLKAEAKNLPESVKHNGVTDDNFISEQVKGSANPWMMSFVKYDPSVNLKKIKCPLLAVNGDKDLQVPSYLNLPAIKKAVTSNGNKNVTVKEYKNLNHLFQETATGNPKEYGIIEQTFSPAVLADMLDWIKGLHF
jgi:uncharacterized protein